MGTPAGWKDFTSTILTTSDVNNYLMSQTVMVFATAAARTSGLGTPNEGNLTYLKDSNSFWYYDGSSWLNMGNVMVFASSAARATAIPAPVEGMLTWLGDVDELEVYNGTSWLRLVVTSDDEGLTVAGNVFANTGNFRANRAGAAGGTTAGGIEFMIDGTTYARIYQSATGRLLTDSDFYLSKRNPVLRIEETGGADNVDIELAQAGVAVTGAGEGLRIRYESGTGHSRVINAYSAGVLGLHSANNTGLGIEVGSDGVPRYIQAPNVYGWHPVFQPFGTEMVLGAYGISGMSWASANAWVTVGSVGITTPNRCSVVEVVYGFTCFVTAGGSILVRLYYTGTGVVEQWANFRNVTYDHFAIAGTRAIGISPNTGTTGTLFLQVYGNGITVTADANDSAYFTAHTV